MRHDELQGVGLLAFSDPAGAKACLAQAALIRAHDAAATLYLFSNKYYDFFADWDTPVTVTEKVNFALLPQRPDWLFTGTSHPDTSGRFELGVLERAGQLSIRSYAFVDHWTNMRLRFTAADGRLILPDSILILDERAQQYAVADGLPIDRLERFPNPYLTYISTLWQPKADRKSILEKIPGSYSRYILYTPDPISLRNANGAWAFDELTVLEDLTIAMRSTPSDVALLIKAHPLQPMESLTQTIKKLNESNPRAVHLAPAFDNLDLGASAEAVVGFHSNFLIETNALGTPVLRYFPASSTQDSLAHLELGRKLYSLQELSAALTKIMI